MVWITRTKHFIGIFLIVVFVVVVLPESSLAASAPSQENWFAIPWFHIGSAQSNSSGISPFSLTPIGLTPVQIRQAYNLPSTGGHGTIAIIDAYDAPTILTDLTVFSTQFNLPTPTSDNFEIHQMVSSLDVVPRWMFETTLDVQWAHAIAPNAKILLVEAENSSWSALLSAVDYATNRSDVVAVSMSWGNTEFPAEITYDSHFTSNHGVVFFAPSGDNGAGVIWPSSSPNVVAVGGTSLNINSDGTLISETAWSGSGGGISAYESQPLYQETYGVLGTNGKRAVPDVSFNADPATGVPVYLSTSYAGQTGWFQVGGTSAATPQWAAIYSLGLSASNPNFYRVAKSNSTEYFRDITLGSNGAYSATLGYDLVTGLGSPITWAFLKNLGVSVSTDRDRYPKWSYVAINVNISDSVSGDQLQGALVKVTVFDTHGRTIWKGSGVPDSIGNFKLVYKLVFNAQMGTYVVAATASLNGYQIGNGQGSFFSLG